jgi:fatty acid desaturase
MIDLFIRKSMDFGIFQMDTVIDRIDLKGSLFLVMTHFGDHALHHLFPTLDHALLPQLYGVFFETCKEFEMELREYPFYKLIQGQYMQQARTKPRTLAEKFGVINGKKEKKL